MAYTPAIKCRLLSIPIFFKRRGNRWSIGATNPPGGRWGGKSISGRDSGMENRALKLIREQLTPTYEYHSTDGKGGTYANLFDAHPPFQIDGNFGCTSGIAEMLLQSHDGCVDLLPALPDAWNTGSVRGLKARGGFTVDISWSDRKINDVRFVSSIGGICRIRSSQPLVMRAGETQRKLQLVANDGEPQNPFFRRNPVADAIVAAGIQLPPPTVEKTYLYEFSAERGQCYQLVVAE